MKKDILLTMTSVQYIGKERSETELITSGTLEKTADGVIVSYEESEATGFEGSKTTVTCKGNDMVDIRRQGANNSTLIIEPGTKHHCHYGTPFGDFTVGIYAHKIENSLDEDGGRLYLKYTVDINSSYISDNEIFLTI
ncbi:MAG: DUF1934 domain-containing protein [Oscillospiraceae bacterium]|jgi:uncharacterized beta-barrel protein YwiB (DUF1934 family)|nr:DUF1934 domain-containing protein [Oscillospiraceae bacterium]MBR4092726.1 DUF1934 domain-containing protein [Oscillospiraceae bacterium]MBR4093719.1 DUF1934 domain-containing protein [Oscillospiraceae bacterium]